MLRNERGVRRGKDFGKKVTLESVQILVIALKIPSPCL